MNGRLAVLADLAAGRKAVQLGHHDVHDDQIIGVMAAHQDGVHAVAGLAHRMPFKFCVFFDDGTESFYSTKSSAQYSS